MKSEYDWVMYLRAGMPFKVYDNSYCYKLEAGKEEKVWLAPGCCDVDGENPYKLVIEKVVESECLGDGIFKMQIPVVYLKSEVTHNHYKVGVCWSEECAESFISY